MNLPFGENTKLPIHPTELLLLLLVVKYCFLYTYLVLTSTIFIESSFKYTHMYLSFYEKLTPFIWVSSIQSKTSSLYVLNNLISLTTYILV